MFINYNISDFTFSYIIVSSIINVWKVEDIMVDRIKTEWLNQPLQNILAGIVVSLALIPEVIAFSFIAGVEPMVGLYASVVMAISISFLGGRPAMISAAAGAIALLVSPLVKEYGVDYLIFATIVMGVIQVIFGLLKVGSLLKFIPNSVMIGFVNALGILIFMAQLEHIFNISFATYIYVIVTLLIVYITPYFIKTIPAPLFAIVILTSVYIMFGADIKTVGDLGDIKRTLPEFIIPNVPYTLDTLLIVLPYSISMAIVGLVESLLTAKIVDDATDTVSNKNKESRGQGFSNIITGLFGGMGGCAMIGQSVVSVEYGGTTRLSTFTAGAFLMFMILVLGDIMVQIPMSVLAAIMVMVSLKTFDWGTFKYIKHGEKSDIFVMLVTVIAVVLTKNLAVGVILGVLLSALFFLKKISNVTVLKTDKETITYHISGNIFYASIESMMDQINFNDINRTIYLNFDDAKIYDDAAVQAIEQIVNQLKTHNEVYVTDLSKESYDKFMRQTTIDASHLVQKRS